MDRAGIRQKVPGAPRTMYLAAERAYGVWELDICRQSGSHAQHRAKESVERSNDDRNSGNGKHGRKARKTGQTTRQQSYSNQSRVTPRNRTWNQGDGIVFVQ